MKELDNTTASWDALWYWIPSCESDRVSPLRALAQFTRVDGADVVVARTTPFFGDVARAPLNAWALFNGTRPPPPRPA